jgi:hypothetical protein
MGSTTAITSYRVGEAHGEELFTDRESAAEPASSDLKLLHSVKEINQCSIFPKDFNGLRYCTKFSQMSQTQSRAAIGPGLPQILNRVIHSFRGHPESAWRLNQLTME